MRRAAALVLALAACCTAATGHSEPVTGIDQVYLALEAGRYPEVEAFYAQLRSDRKRAPDGTFLIEEFYHSVYWCSSDDPASPDYWPKVDAGTRAWVERAPGSYLAAMTRAFALAYHARHLEVQGKWSEMDKLVAEARKLMDRSRAAGASDVLWHATRLRVASVEGLPRSDVVDLIHAALAVDPYPLRLWEEAAFALSPDGKKAEDLIWLARLAQQRTAGQEGTSMYARVLGDVFWYYPEFESSPFLASGLDWRVLQDSFLDWKKRYPSGYPVDFHATLACAAYDKPVATELLARIGGHPRLDVWELMGGKGTLARCREWVKDPVKARQTVWTRSL